MYRILYVWKEMNKKIQPYSITRFQFLCLGAEKAVKTTTTTPPTTVRNSNERKKIDAHAQNHHTHARRMNNQPTTKHNTYYTYLIPSNSFMKKPRESNFFPLSFYLSLFFISCWLLLTRYGRFFQFECFVIHFIFVIVHSVDLAAVEICCGLEFFVPIDLKLSFLF